MQRDDDPYAELAAAFVEHYATLRGRLRFELLAEQLDGFLGEPPLEILDVGGGAGHQAARLAALGHRVTLLDPSPDMLARAEQLRAQQPDVAERVRLLRGYAHEAAELVGARRFALVCCHAVLPYVDDATTLMSQVSELATRGGLLSVVFKNRDALAMRAALEQRWQDAAATFDADGDVGGLGVETQAHTLAEIREAIVRSGASIEQWFGIRVFSDHLDDGALDRFRDILRVEREASSRDPYRQVARLIHLVARRRS